MQCNGSTISKVGETSYTFTFSNGPADEKNAQQNSLCSDAGGCHRQTQQEASLETLTTTFLHQDTAADTADLSFKTVSLPICASTCLPGMHQSHWTRGTAHNSTFGLVPRTTKPRRIRARHASPKVQTNSQSGWCRYAQQPTFQASSGGAGILCYAQRRLPLSREYTVVEGRSADLFYQGESSSMATRQVSHQKRIAQQNSPYRVSPPLTHGPQRRNGRSPRPTCISCESEIGSRGMQPPDHHYPPCSPTPSP
jgi:hypothetical protein